MDATQMLSDSMLPSDEEEENDDTRVEPLAKLRILKNAHIPETELPLYLGENVLGRDPNTCTLPLHAQSVSKRHTAISLSVFRGRTWHDEVNIEALVWDLGSMNGTRKGRIKLTPHVRYALSEGDNLMVADIPCQYICSTDAGTAINREALEPKCSQDLVVVAQRKGDVGNGNAKESAIPSLLEYRETMETTAKINGLSFELTPIQPQGSLVPESDSESDGELGRKDQQRKALVSDSDSHASGPTCSTFLSPNKQIIPESEDESPIIPSSSSSSKNRPVNVHKEERDMVVWRQLKEKGAQLIVDDSGEEQERAVSVGTKPGKCGGHSSGKRTNRVDLWAEDELDVPGPVAFTDAVPILNMDSDTDAEGEEERSMSAGLVTSNTPPPPANQPTSLDQFHMDSDTDADDDDGQDDPKSGPSPSVRATRYPDAVLATVADANQDILSDSDTDVEEDSPLAPPVITKATNHAPSSAGALSSASAPVTRSEVPRPDSDAVTDVDESSVPPAGEVAQWTVDFRLDSDTDVEDEEVAPEETIGGQISGSSGDKDLESLRCHGSPLMKCPLPAALSGGAIAEMETQEFLSPSLEPFKCPNAPATRLMASPSCSDSQEEDDFVVAETQSFIMDNRDHQASPARDYVLDETQPFDPEHMPTNEEDHLTCRTRALAMEATQAFVSIDADLEAIQLYQTSPSVDRSSMEEDLEATQSYVGNDESNKRSSGTESQVDFILEATQRYIPDEEVAGEEDKRLDIATAETQLMDLPSPSRGGTGVVRPGQVREEVEEPEINQVKPVVRRSTRKLQGKEGGKKERLDREKSERAEKELEKRERLREQEEKRREKREEEEEERVKREEQLKLEQEREEMERLEREYEERIERERKEQEEKERIERERKEQEEKERIERERKEQEEKIEREIKDEKERLERERKEQEEKERLERERKEKERLERERKEQEEKERLERERKEQEEKERIESERKEQEEKERIERERKEKESMERERKEEKERIERERKEQEEKERIERERKEEKERIERERKEQEEKERIERERKEQEEKERIERERKEEKERIERERKEEKERIERERKEQEEKEQIERERKEQEEKERIERENKERIEKKRKELEKNERIEREKNLKEKKRLDMLQKKKEEQERLECEKKEREDRVCLERGERERMEKERQEREERERIEKERQEHEERERLEKERQEREERERLESTKREMEEVVRQNEEKELSIKEKQLLEQQQRGAVAQNEAQKPQTTRGRRATRRITATPSEAEPEHDAPAMRTRSRSNSTNSVSSERSASSLDTQESKGRGRGRGAKKSCPPVAGNATREKRRRTVAGESPAEGLATKPHNVPGRGVQSPSTSADSFNYDVSICTLSSPNRAKGARGGGRGRKTLPAPETLSKPFSSSQGEPGSTPRGRGRKCRKLGDSSNNDSRVDGEEKTGPQQLTSTRGRRRTNTNDPEPMAVEQKGRTTQDYGATSEDSFLEKRSTTGRGRGQKVIKCESITTPAAGTVNDTNEVKYTGSEDGRTSKVEGENKGVKPAPARGRVSTVWGRSSNKPHAQGLKEEEESEEETVQRKARGRPTVSNRKQRELEKEDEATVANAKEQNASAEASEVTQTPRGKSTRKRGAPAEPSPAAKSPRSSTVSPRSASRPRAACQPYKVLFTGLADEAGEMVVARLGGSLATGVFDVTHLVTDKVRRTVKFLCAMARGIPVVTAQWLKKSGKAGSFLSTDAFIVKDKEQEKKFAFCLQESLRIASHQPLLQGYEIHVTKSVKPEPTHMKDIISCCGAIFLAKMPSSHKEHTLVISCEEDWALCGPAIAASLPVVTAEFMLTGILQQKADVEAHALQAPSTNSQPGGRGRGRK